jgi:proteasome lid subunit RPN8/RPN11
MNNLRDSHLSLIREHAEKVYPEECCGLIISVSDAFVILECKNTAEDKNHFFSLSPTDYIRGGQIGKIVGYYHSENIPVDGRVFSELDIINFKIHGLWSVIYNNISKQFYCLSGQEELKYLGRNFSIGNSDCFSLVRDYLKNELGINVRDYKRDSKWFLKSPRLWLDNYSSEGFRPTNVAQKNDIILFGEFDLPTHAGVYMGNNLILHHPRNQWSTIEPINENLRQQIKLILRYEPS